MLVWVVTNESERCVWESFAAAWADYKDTRSNGWGRFEVVIFPKLMRRERFNALTESRGR